MLFLFLAENRVPLLQNVSNGCLLISDAFLNEILLNVHCLPQSWNQCI